jgi:MFS family permease
MDFTLSDTFGRRHIIMASGLFATVVGLQVLWIPNVYAYLAIRFFLGIAYTGLMTTSTYKSEIFSADHRYIAITCDFSVVLGAITLPLISSYIQVCMA